MTTKPATTPKKSIKKRASKAVVTQDNRFIYAKYDMNANEMKFFMWIVAQLNSQRDTLFQVCEISVSEILEVFNFKSSEHYTYIKKLIDNMARKVYIEDFKLLDETTMKEVDTHIVMPLFQFLKYKKGEAYIEYRLNDSLTQYLLDQRRDFTQLKFTDIQQMKSAYSIRIYNMLMCEIKQNRQKLKINLAALQNILEVPKTLQEYKHFNQKVLAQAKKDINAKSNLVLLEIKPIKTGRKVTDLEFIFDYKNNDERIQRDQDKKKKYNQALLEILESYIGKTIYLKDFGELVCENKDWDDDIQRVFLLCKQQSSGRTLRFSVKEFKDINSLERHRKKAEELFYLDTDKVQQAFDFREQLKSGDVFKKIVKKI